MTAHNILSQIPEIGSDEVFETILQTNNLKIERIISAGHSSPPGFWYDQEQNEWVMVVQGQARLKFGLSNDIVDMKAGDYIHIPAHCKHRVEWTDPNQVTIWLAIHY